MKLFSTKFLPAAALALFATAPALASSSFLVDFEQSWVYGSTIDNTYSALGVNFSNFLGLSNNDGMGGLSGGDYYQNAPSPVGVAFVQLDGVINTTSYMNVSAGVDNSLSFYFSTPGAVSGAVKAYSGENGTGTLLGTFDLSANSADYTNWTQATFSFAGTAKSFDFTGSANLVAFDNIAAVPEANGAAMLLAGLGLMGFVARRRKQA